jgi:hypothetical protein
MGIRVSVIRRSRALPLLLLAAACGAPGRARAPAPARPARVPAAAVPETPPPLHLLSVRPGLFDGELPRSNSKEDMVGWFQSAIPGLAAAPLYRPILVGGRALLTDGHAFARISGDLLTWAPELDCALDVRSRLPTLWGRDPDFFSMGASGFVRFDSTERRWMPVGPERARWPSDATVTEWSSGLLVLWRLRPTLVLETSGDAGVVPAPAKLAPGFYLLDRGLTPLGLVLRPELTNQAMIELRVTGGGDVVLLSSAGADIWRKGQSESVSVPLRFADYPSGGGIPPEQRFLDVDGRRAPEIVYRAPGDAPAIVRFDGLRWSSVSVPFGGGISAWARDGSARLYAEETLDGARIWRRLRDDRWNLLDALPRGVVQILARDGEGAVWAFAKTPKSVTGDLWYISGPGKHVRVALPADQQDLSISQFFMIDQVAWVIAMGRDLRMATFSSREFRQTGPHLGANDDGCGK